MSVSIISHAISSEVLSLPDSDKLVEAARSNLLKVELTRHAHEGLVRLIHISRGTKLASDYSMLCSVVQMMLMQFREVLKLR
jgi:hypothetical protein